MLTARRMLLLGCGLVIVAGIWLAAAGSAITGGAMIGVGALGIVVIAVRGSRRLAPFTESDDITQLSDARRRELMRGTSLFLREMKYRYSVRLDTREAGDRRCFAAEVNAIRLGFIPAVVTDNGTDRQGYGFVAFVHDGRRWRGPGLPCPADQAQAVQHAARCVSPLATEEETRFDEDGFGSC